MNGRQEMSIEASLKLPNGKTYCITLQVPTTRDNIREALAQLGHFVLCSEKYPHWWLP